MKITRVGWVGKSDKVRIGEDLFDHILKIYPALSARGRKEEYYDRNWPPRKVWVIVTNKKP